MLGAIALLAHLLLPLTSAQAASRHDAALQAFCGGLNPALLASVRVHAPELYELMRQQQAQCDKAGCPDCQLTHAGGLPGRSDSLLANLGGGRHEAIAAASSTTPRVSLVMLPESRGPPRQVS